MDPGTIVWMPGTGFDWGEANQSCQQTYGSNYYACGSEYFQEWYSTAVYCCA